MAKRFMAAMFEALRGKCDCQPCITLRTLAEELEAELKK